MQQAEQETQKKSTMAILFKLDEGSFVSMKSDKNHVSMTNVLRPNSIPSVYIPVYILFYHYWTLTAEFFNYSIDGQFEILL